MDEKGQSGQKQESVWDYPCPPRVEPVLEQIRIIFNGEKIAKTNRAFRVLETSHPPVYYLPPEGIQMELLTQTEKSSYCEWKGRAVYYSLSVAGKNISNVAWTYQDPTPGFEQIQDYLAFYAGPMDACYLGEEQVTPQPGGFYGGWITENISGPFKGGPGSVGW
jgi:uncharacterized protein (DUF427 family)